MVHTKHRSLVIGLAVLILALAGGTVFAATWQPSGAVTASSSLSTPPQPPEVGATQTTDEGLAVTLIQVVKHGSRWLFQFQLRNIAQTALTVRGTGDVHQFVVAGNTGAAPPNNIGYAQLGSPSASEAAANYPDLATSLQAGGKANGWLVVDTTNLGFTPTELDYRFGSAPATACGNPADKSTCHPDTLYQSLIWYNI